MQVFRRRAASAHLRVSDLCQVVVDGGRGTFDLRPQNLRPTQEVDPTAPEVAAAQEASAAVDGLCHSCRTAARQWQSVLKSRRDKLNTMPVMHAFISA